MAQERGRLKLRGTALGMLALGFCSATVGALFVAPAIAAALGETKPAAPPRRAAAPPAPAVSPDAAPAPTDFEPAGPPASLAPRPVSPSTVSRPAEPAPSAKRRRGEHPEADLGGNRHEAAPPVSTAGERPDSAIPRPAAGTPREPDGGEPTPPVASPAAPAGPVTAAPVPAAPRRSAYRVRVGTYASRDAAEQARDDLRRAGAPGFIVRGGDGYRVQVGVYRTRPSADQLAERLRAHNFPAAVYDSPRPETGSTGAPEPARPAEADPPPAAPRTDHDR